MLRREQRRWNLQGILRLSDTCVILHNIIIRMAEAGSFYEEAGGADVVTEL